jgi:hypothetical protein
MSWDDEEYVPEVPNLAALSGVGEEIKDKTLEELSSAVSAVSVSGGSAPAAAGGAKKPKQILKEAMLRADDVPLDDPVAEKARQQRLILESDVAIASESLGVQAQDAESLLSRCTLLSADDFTKLGQASAKRVHEAAGEKGTSLAMSFYVEAISVAGKHVRRFGEIRVICAACRVVAVFVLLQLS